MLRQSSNFFSYQFTLDVPRAKALKYQKGDI